MPNIIPSWTYLGRKARFGHEKLNFSERARTRSRPPLNPLQTPPDPLFEGLDEKVTFSTFSRVVKVIRFAPGALPKPPEGSGGSVRRSDGPYDPKSSFSTLVIFDVFASEMDFGIDLHVVSTPFRVVPFDSNPKSPKFMFEQFDPGRVQTTLQTHFIGVLEGFGGVLEGFDQNLGKWPKNHFFQTWLSLFLSMNYHQKHLQSCLEPGFMAIYLKFDLQTGKNDHFKVFTFETVSAASTLFGWIFSI